MTTHGDSSTGVGAGSSEPGGSDYIRVHRSDLEKVRHALDKGHLYLKRLNEMNAALHLSDPSYSPLTGTLGNALTRVDQLLDGVNSETG